MPIRIMVANGHVLFRQGLKSLLESTEDFEVIVETENGDDTIDKLSERKPDVLLLDITLPKADKVQDWIKTHKEEVRAKVVIMSCSENEESIDKSDSVANAYLYQKSDFKELKEIIYAVTGEKNYISTSIKTKQVLNAGKQDKEKERTNSLTRRELEVLRLLAVGMYNKEIAQNLDISERTVKNHVSNIFRKITVNDRTQAAIYAIKNNLINI